MSIDNQLDQFCDEPTITVAIAGRPYRFSELPIAALGRLQAWLRANAVHPIDAVKGHLDGLCESDRHHLLSQARAEARTWPPVIGSPAAAAVLMGGEEGQVEVFYEGLKVHQPDTTRETAALIYRALKRDVAKASRAAAKAGVESDGDGPAGKIFGVLFGAGVDEDDDAPKA